MFASAYNLCPVLYAAFGVCHGADQNNLGGPSVRKNVSENWGINQFAIDHAHPREIEKVPTVGRIAS